MCLTEGDYSAKFGVISVSVTIHQGDCREVLTRLENGSVHCCVTSPPYFGLRDYGTAKWEGGDAECDHKKPRADTGHVAHSTLDGGLATNAAQVGGYRDTCGKCGARRIDSQIGLEPTPDAFVAEMVAVFREVRRVLRDDGTCWLNLGDSYSSGGGSHDNRQDNQPGVGASRVWRDGAGRADGVVDERGQRIRNGILSSGLAPKNLIGIPWRVAFALQADGWYLRQDIIWSKPNPMPESVTDRCTKAHEYLFLLSKSPRYYFDAKAISEPVAESTVARLAQPTLASQRGSDRVPGKTNGPMKARPPRFGGQKYGDNEAEIHRTKSGNEYTVSADGRRNKRTVWTVTTKPFKGAHFATFPPGLIEPCILAGCPVSGTVLDPFGGAGTTGLVADRLGRKSILIELNPEYADMAERRIAADQAKRIEEMFA